MRSAVLVLALAACGQTYQKPGDAGPPPAADEERAARRPPARPPARKPAAPSAKPAKAEKKPSSVAQRWVAAHNTYRAKHCAAPLTWSTKLADIAQKWANTLKAKGCAFEHSPGAKYGENLAGGTSGALDPEGATTMWYDEIKKYNFAKGGFSMETGHFTQVVWTTTKQVGCGQVTCKGMDIYVCNYDPPGNWQGQYKQHVLPTSCKKK